MKLKTQHLFSQIAEFVHYVKTHHQTCGKISEQNFHLASLRLDSQKWKAIVKAPAGTVVIHIYNLTS